MSGIDSFAEEERVRPSRLSLVFMYIVASIPLIFIFSLLFGRDIGQRAFGLLGTITGVAMWCRTSKVGLTISPEGLVVTEFLGAKRCSWTDVVGVYVGHGKSAHPSKTLYLTTAGDAKDVIVQSVARSSLVGAARGRAALARASVLVRRYGERFGGWDPLP